MENNYGSTLEDIFYGEYKGESFEFGKSILVNIIKELIESKKIKMELLEYLQQTLDTQTAGRLEEAIQDSGGVETVKELLKNFNYD